MSNTFPRVYVMLCYVILCLLCYAMVGCCAVPCPKNFSAQSDPVSLCASDNKRLVTCDKGSRERLLLELFRKTPFFLKVPCKRPAPRSPHSLHALS